MKAKYFLIFVVCVLIYCIPLGAVISISNKEIKKYNEDKDFKTELMAYGAIEEVKKTDMREYYKVDVTVTSIENLKITLSNEANVQCREGEEIHKNDVLANDRGKTIKSGFNGIIESVDYTDDSIVINYNDFKNLVYEASVDEDKFDDFNMDCFYDNDGKKIKVLKKSNMIEEGKFKVWLSIADKHAIYGKSVKGYELYTGVIYKKALVVPIGCVYSTDGNSYIRTVDENGIYKSDIEVKTGFANDEFICISGDGVEEGMYCDTGYAKVKEEKSEEVNEEN